MELPIEPSSDAPSPELVGLVPLDRVADELRIARGALWQKLHRSGTPIHRVRKNGVEQAAIDVVTFERLRGGAPRPGPRSLAHARSKAAPTAGETLADHVRRLEEERERARFEASTLERQLVEARDRTEAVEQALRSARDEIARLEIRLDEAEHSTLVGAETAKLLVASEERAEGLARRTIELEAELSRTRERAHSAERLQDEVDDLRARLVRADERCARAAVELDQIRSEHAEELAERKRELDHRACQNGGLKSQLARSRRNLADARRELAVLKELERSQANYCDRLEERLRAFESASDG